MPACGFVDCNLALGSVAACLRKPSLMALDQVRLSVACLLGKAGFFVWTCELSGAQGLPVLFMLLLLGLNSEPHRC